ncbi:MULTISPECIES: hypothetical protein [unclassified Sphingopyxis]|uniref:hypothetical protein n=1 Tax=unclassified Sphingopyxis TaxID=2614943 RepID=UPI00286428FB|nr:MULTISPECIES: hypothetical protein [unclassified Sphingopyxis]MDR7059775.1 putative repeat protein (TIGR01451 family) [Sphingopyxis sp. BE235]MDR7180713.1 putative repeat protein (TIGR01451 family) [Sphingopyxis sp. BE249]
MTSKLTYTGVIGLAALSSVVATPAFAAGTTAGTTITNTATVDYQVGGVAQGQQSASNNFTVDRKINLLVEEVGTVTTNVVPGQTNAVTTFQLTNSSNEVLDFALVASQIVGGTASHGGTDTFNANNVRIYRDNSVTGTVGSWDVGDTLITAYVDELVVDTAIRLFVVSDIPAGLANNAVAGVTLRATAREGGLVGTQGAAITETTGANTAGKDTVFADIAGVAGDVARDGSHSDNDDYTVQTATLTVTKTSRVISDPFNNTTNPKLIPGAVVEYCIAVANSGGAAATSVVINDPVPGQLTFNAGTILLGGTVTSGTCDFNGTAGGSYTAPNVSGTIASIAAGAASTLVFRATVN